MSAIIDHLKNLYSQRTGERVMEASDFDRLLAVTKENEAIGCLEWIGAVAKKDHAPIFKFRKIQKNPRTVLFKLQFPLIIAKKVFNICGNPKCIAPEHSSNQKKISPMAAKLSGFVEVQGILTTPCHLFRRHTGRNTYPKYSDRGKTLYAHREIIKLKNGYIPKGLQVHHKCNDKRCFSIEHLELVTAKQNMAYAKGDGLLKVQRASGESHGGAKLDNAEFLDVRLSKKQGVSTARLMEAHEISRSHVTKILNGGLRKNVKSLGRVTLRIDEENLAKDSVSAERQTTDEWARIHIVQDGSEIAAYVKYQGGPKILDAIDQYLTHAQLKFSRTKAA